MKTNNDCNWLERVSSLTDGELDQAERAATEEHVATCEYCRAAMAEFATIRRELRSVPLRKQMAGSSPMIPFRPRRAHTSVVRAALVATLVGVLIGASTVLLFTGIPGADQIAGEDSSHQQIPLEQTLAESGLSRFDHGQRAIIIKTSRDTTETGGAQ